MKPTLVVTAVAVAALSACGSTTSTPAPSSPAPSTSPAMTTLPTLGSPAGNVRVLVPLTHGVGGRGFDGAVYRGKELTIEIACLGGGPFKLRYAGGFLGGTCNGEIGQVGEAATNFKVGSATSFDLETDGAWELRVTEAQ